MKIFIVSSKHLYHNVVEIKQELERKGNVITLPNSYDDPLMEEKAKANGKEHHEQFKAEMFRLQNRKIEDNDAILVLNFKKGEQENYIGGSVFLEMFKAWELGKKIYLYNPIPNNMLKDEIEGFGPIIIDRDLDKVK
jgi:hypothetical protein